MGGGRLVAGIFLKKRDEFHWRVWIQRIMVYGLFLFCWLFRSLSFFPFSSLYDERLFCFFYKWFTSMSIKRGVFYFLMCFILSVLFEFCLLYFYDFNGTIGILLTFDLYFPFQRFFKTISWNSLKVTAYIYIF
jgi:hypothetical protein